MARAIEAAAGSDRARRAHLRRAWQRGIALDSVDVARRRKRDHELAMVTSQLGRSAIRPMVPFLVAQILAPLHADCGRVRLRE